MSKPADDSGPPPSAPLVEFLNTLPSPLTTTLVGLAPAISRARYFGQLLTWRAPWQDCWLLLASWWAVCLLPELGLRYLLPLAVLILSIRLRAGPKTQPAPPPAAVTEDTLQRAIADLTTLHALFTSLPVPIRASTQPISIHPLVLLRSIAVLYIPYLALTYAVRIRILLALAGTLLLTWRARWAAVLRGALWRSAHLRWAMYRAWALLSGQPLPLVPLSPQSRADAQLASLASSPSSSSALVGHGGKLPEASFRFLFTLYENQRWWMGLDWTAALVPGERPSWCSASQQPAAPPSAFTLPAPTTAYTMTADGKGRVKRVARWRWEEDEWRVVVRKEGSVGASVRVERPVPQPKEESAAAAGASRILMKMRTGSLDLSERGAEKEGEGQHHAGDGVSASGSGDVKGSSGNGDGDGEEVEEPLTDADGWVYADNKWEGASCKGGMGKYTRFRRWTRIAVLTETVEIVGPGALGVRRDDAYPQPQPQPQPQQQQPSAVAIAGTSGVPASKSASEPITPSPSQVQVGGATAKTTLLDSSGAAGMGHHHRASSLSTTPVPPPPPPAEGANREKDLDKDKEGTPVSSPAKEESRLRQRLKAAVLGATGGGAEHS